MGRRIPERAFVSLLDREGEALDSVAFSRFLEERRQSGQDLCFVIGGPFGLELEDVDHRLSLGAITLPHQLARVVLLEQVYRAPQDPGRRAVSLLRQMTVPDREQWSQSGAWGFPGTRRPGAPPRPEQRAHARREVQLVHAPARDPAGGARRAGRRSARSAFVVMERVSVGYGFEWTLDTVTTLGSIPDPATPAGGRQGRPRAARHRYALLRAGHRRGVLRVRPAQRRARGAPDREDDRFLQRPLHRLRLRPGGPPGLARPARRGRPARGDRSQPDPTARRPGRPGSRSSRARPPTTRCSRRRGSRAHRA